MSDRLHDETLAMSRISKRILGGNATNLRAGQTVTRYLSVQDVADLQAVLAEVTRMRELVEALTDSADCWYDHHGYCQAHRLDPKPCPHERAKEATAAYRRATGGTE